MEPWFFLVLKKNPTRVSRFEVSAHAKTHRNDFWNLQEDYLDKGEPPGATRPFPGPVIRSIHTEKLLQTLDILLKKVEFSGISPGKMTSPSKGKIYSSR